MHAPLTQPLGAALATAYVAVLSLVASLSPALCVLATHILRIPSRVNCIKESSAAPLPTSVNQCAFHHIHAPHRRTRRNAEMRNLLPNTVR